MASFSHQNYHPFPQDSSHLPLQQLQGTSEGLPSFPCCSPADGISEASAFSAETQMECGSSGAIDPHTIAGKKRKNKEGSSLSFAESKTKESKARRGKRPSDSSGIKEPPIEYIHVRARRGQATDSHSLAERVRRERISERMKMLQGLVPGCDKVTGKALILDEIINYVQSLQNQVEFLSMRIASVSPILYGFGMDMDGLNVQPQALQQDSVPVLPQGTTNSYPVMESSASSLLQDNNGDLVMQMGDQRQGLLNQVLFNNICSFQ